jgi:hypothetical protein
LRQLDRSQADVGYSALISAAFFEAARRRFIRNGKPADDAEVIDYIATVRGRSDDAADVIVPDLAERLTNYVLGKLPYDANQDIDPNVAIRIKTLLLAGLVGDEELSGPELDAFMTKARDLAEESLR